MKRFLTRSVKKCPECGSKDINYAPERGEISCRNCGYVIIENLPIIQTYGEIADKTFYSTEEKKIGAILPNYLRTVEERAIKRLVQDMRRLSVRLKRHQRKELTDKYVELYKEGWTERRKREAVISALAFLILRREEEPILLGDFRFAKEEKILRYARLISRKTDLKLIPGNPKKFIQRFGNQLRIPEYLITSALTVYDKCGGKGLFRNRSYKTVALACLLVACKSQGITFSEEELKSIVKVDLTVQSELRREIREEIDPEKILKISEFFE